MKKFIIPVYWSMIADMEIEAETLEEAKQKAIDADLPDGQYMADSFEINEEVLNEWYPADKNQGEDQPNS